MNGSRPAFRLRTDLPGKLDPNSLEDFVEPD